MNALQKDRMFNKLAPCFAYLNVIMHVVNIS